jgi:acyl-CoA thioesterase FadM
MCTAEQTLVLIELAERRPTPIPERFRTVVAALEGADVEQAVRL